MVMPASVDYTEAAAVINAAFAEGRSATEALTQWSGRPFSTVTNWVHKCRQLGLVPPAETGHRNGGRGRKLTIEEIEQRRADREAATVARRAQAAADRVAAAASRRAQAEAAAIARRERLAAQREEQRLALIAARQREKDAKAAARVRERAQAKAARDAQRAAARAERLAAKGVTVTIVHTYVPREGVTPAPAVDRTPGGGSPGVASARVLACDECEFEAEVTRPADLIRHCVQVHHRQPTRDERTPARVPGGAA